MTYIAQGSVDTYDPKDQYAGEADIVSQSGTVASGNDVERLTVLGRITASGFFAPYDPAATDGTEVALRIAAEAINASAADVEGPMYTGGVFNIDELVWPAGATDLQKQAAFDGTNISVNTVLNSSS